MTSLKPTSRGNLGRFIIFIPVGSSYILLTYLVENPALTLKAQGKEVELKSSRPTGLLLHFQDQTSLNKFHFLMLKLGGEVKVLFGRGGRWGGDVCVCRGYV